MRYAIYARKSTESEERQVQSLDDQLAVLHSIASRENLTIAETFVEACSAKEPGARPEFERMLSMIRRGRVEGILTWHVNRLSRNMVDGGMLAHLLHSGTLHCIRTPDRVFRPEDNVLLLAIENGVATGYVHDLSKSVKRGMAGKAERGWMPGRAPLGYLNDANTHEIYADPQRFELVRSAWRMLLVERLNPARIHTRLVALGLTNASRKAGGRLISASVVYSMFRNPFYSGYFRYDGELRVGKHQPMVTPHEFNQAQELLRTSHKTIRRTHTHRFSGVLICAKCGCQIVGETKWRRYKNGREASFIYYHCTGARGCSRKGVRESVLSGAFLAACDAVSLKPDAAALCRELCLLAAEREAIDSAAVASNWASRRSMAEQRMARLQRMLMDEQLDVPDYRAMKATVERDIIQADGGLIAARDEERSIRQGIEQRLDVAVSAASYTLLAPDEQTALAKALGGPHLLNGAEPLIKLDPVLQQIATFEPVRSGSWSGETPTSLLRIPAWLGFVQAIREAARESLTPGQPRLRSRTVCIKRNRVAQFSPSTNTHVPVAPTMGRTPTSFSDLAQMGRERLSRRAELHAQLRHRAMFVTER